MSFFWDINFFNSIEYLIFNQMGSNILPTHRFVWGLLCAYSVNEKQSTWKKWTLKLFPLFSFVSHSCLITSSAAFCIEFIWTDLEVSLHAFAQIVTFFHWIVIVPVGFIRRHKIFAVFDKLTEIHTKCKWYIFDDQKMKKMISRFGNLFDWADQNMDSYEYMLRANKIGELLWHYYFKFMLYSFISTMVFMTSSIYLCWLMHGNFDVRYLYRPFKVV